MEEDGKEEQPRHIISKTAEEISCIRTAMKGDGVLRKLSEAQLNALINEFDELKVRVTTLIGKLFTTSELLGNWLQALAGCIRKDTLVKLHRIQQSYKKDH